MKFDELIEGFSEMSAEDKLAAIEKYEAKPIVDEKEINRLKGLLSKANTEAAENKRKLNERLTEEEKTKAAQEEKDAKYAEMEKAYKKLTYIGALRNSGYSEENAEAIAEAYSSGNSHAMFEAMKKHTEQVKADVLSEIAKNTQIPPANSGNSINSKSKEEQIAERLGKQRAEGNKVTANVLNKFLNK
ncbi:MAG: hypothetical protein ACI4I6_09560 [Hominimerdicola sp.]